MPSNIVQVAAARARPQRAREVQAVPRRCRRRKGQGFAVVSLGVYGSAVGGLVFCCYRFIAQLLTRAQEAKKEASGMLSNAPASGKLTTGAAARALPS